MPELRLRALPASRSCLAVCAVLLIASLLLLQRNQAAGSNDLSGFLSTDTTGSLLQARPAFDEDLSNIVDHSRLDKAVLELDEQAEEQLEPAGYPIDAMRPVVPLSSLNARPKHPFGDAGHDAVAGRLPGKNDADKVEEDRLPMTDSSVYYLPFKLDASRPVLVTAVDSTHFCTYLMRTSVREC